MIFITFSVIYKNDGLFLCILHIRSQRLTHIGHAYSVYKVIGHAYSVYKVIGHAYSVYKVTQSKHRNTDSRTVLFAGGS